MSTSYGELAIGATTAVNTTFGEVSIRDYSKTHDSIISTATIDTSNIVASRRPNPWDCNDGRIDGAMVIGSTVNITKLAESKQRLIEVIDKYIKDELFQADEEFIYGYIQTDLELRPSRGSNNNIEQLEIGKKFFGSFREAFFSLSRILNDARNKGVSQFNSIRSIASLRDKPDFKILKVKIKRNDVEEIYSDYIMTKNFEIVEEYVPVPSMSFKVENVYDSSIINEYNINVCVTNGVTKATQHMTFTAEKNKITAEHIKKLVSSRIDECIELNNLNGLSGEL